MSTFFSAFELVTPRFMKLFTFIRIKCETHAGKILDFYYNSHILKFYPFWHSKRNSFQLSTTKTVNFSALLCFCTRRVHESVHRIEFAFMSLRPLWLVLPLKPQLFFAPRLHCLIVFDVRKHRICIRKFEWAVRSSQPQIYSLYSLHIDSNSFCDWNKT